MRKHFLFNNLTFISSHSRYLVCVKEKDTRKHVKLVYRHQILRLGGAV
jgi:hypothetical protein